MLEHASDALEDGVGFVADLHPGDACGPVAGGDEDLVPAAIALEGCGGTVSLFSVGLDRQPLLFPEQVYFEGLSVELELGVGPWNGEALFDEEWKRRASSLLRNRGCGSVVVRQPERIERRRGAPRLRPRESTRSISSTSSFLRMAACSTRPRSRVQPDSPAMSTMVREMLVQQMPSCTSISSGRGRRTRCQRIRFQSSVPTNPVGLRGRPAAPCPIGPAARPHCREKAPLPRCRPGPQQAATPFG